MQIKKQLKRGDLVIYATRVGLSRSRVGAKVNGLAKITEEELNVLKQVIDERIEKEQRAIEALKNIIQ